MFNILVTPLQGVAGASVGGGASMRGGTELSSLLSHLVASTAADIKKQLATLLVGDTLLCWYTRSILGLHFKVFILLLRSLELVYF